jgi:hypothetical protein
MFRIQCLRIAARAALLGTVVIVALSSCDDGSHRDQRGGPFANGGGANVDSGQSGKGGQTGTDAGTTDAKTDAKTDATTDGAKDGATAGKDSGMIVTGTGGRTGSGASNGTAGNTGTINGTGGMAMIGGASCTACETQNCGDINFLFDLCVSGKDPATGLAAKAAAGPAQGDLKKDLCQAVVSCVRRTGCETWGQNGAVQPCWCGQGVDDLQCLTGKAMGPCKTEIEEAAEIRSATSAPEDTANNFVDPTYALGAAVNLIQECDAQFCQGPCLGLSGGATGSGGVSGSGVGGRSGSGGSGVGTTGSGGSTVGGGTGGGTGTAGMTGNGAGGTGNKTVTYTQCRMCEQTKCADELVGCEQLTGTAASGPKSGTSRKDLCLAVVACARATTCTRSGDSQACLCGTADDIPCLTGQGNGPCRAQIEAAAETADPTEVASRFTFDPTLMDYAIGRATTLNQCDGDNCSQPCTNGDPVTVGGSGGATGTGGMTTTGSGGSSGAGTGATTGTGSGAAGGGRGGAGGVTGTAGAAGGGTGSGGAPAVACPDLDHNSKSDCQETLVSNPGFDRAMAPWSAEYATTAVWRGTNDGVATEGSGSVDVANTTVADLDGTTMGGARQCIPATAGTIYALYAQLQIPSGQGAGWGGVNIQYFASTDCSGNAAGVFSSTLIGEPGAWKQLQGSTQAAAGAHSMAVRLVVVKTFRNPVLHVFFDNVLLKAQ